MDARTITILSGILLLAIFALVGWRVRQAWPGRGRPRREPDPAAPRKGT